MTDKCLGLNERENTCIVFESKVTRTGQNCKRGEGPYVKRRPGEPFEKEFPSRFNGEETS